jgi:2-C-methyl-D-erythritol 2,4-cyclodiphosphate synthase
MTYRIGTGYDIHRLIKGRLLWLGGIQIPFEKGLDGHSDADVLLHAITDAILGAAALPDIGRYFPPSDPTFKGIASTKMLAKAVQEIHRLGFRISNVDTVVIAESPKMAPHREAMRKTIARILQVPVSAVQIKGKTNEGLGDIGKGDAIAAQAVVLLSHDPNP